MAFIYEKVQPEDYELFDSIGWYDVFYHPINRHSYHWCKDVERNLFLLVIGTHRFDPPLYCDFYFKGRIIRLEVEYTVDPCVNGICAFCWNIQRISIPKSIWNDKTEIVSLIKEAFFVNDFGLSSRGKTAHITINLPNECEQVEADYHGK